MTEQSVPPLLEALDEPALLLNPAGHVLAANRAAATLLGGEPAGATSLAALFPESPAQVQALLHHGLGTGETVPGGLDRAGIRLRARIRRFPGTDDPVLLLRLERGHEQFAALSEKVRALDAELARNRQITEELRDALRHKEVLLSELHHRVKNNLQTLSGILLLAETATGSKEVLSVLQDVRLRIEAMGIVQRMIYHEGQLDGIDGLAFLNELATNVAQIHRVFGLEVLVQGESAFIQIQVASPLGLIANELVANAFKRSCQKEIPGRMVLRLERNDDMPDGLVLVVSDEGPLPGVPPLSLAAHGLVEGLADQLGGELSIEDRPDGLTCRVTFRARVDHPPVRRE